MSYPKEVSVVKDNVAGSTVYKVFDDARPLAVYDASYLEAAREVQKSKQLKKLTTAMLVATCATEDEVKLLFPLAQYTDAEGKKRWFNNGKLVRNNPRVYADVA